MHDRHSLLVLGGARSGKSVFAEERCSAENGKKIYLATAQAHDDEMQSRIQQHQERRGTDWRLLEEPLELVGALEGNAAAGHTILVDCITLWMSNLMMNDGDVAGEVARLADIVPTLAGNIVLVTNEVGLGIVPDNALARAFRDEAGLANQMLADTCDEVVFMAAGLPMWLKGRRN